MSTKENTNTVQYVITKSLGYCCLWAFFSKYRDTKKISDRTGFSPRTIKSYKSWATRGEGCCEKSPRCMAKAFNLRPNIPPARHQDYADRLAKDGPVG